MYKKIEDLLEDDLNNKMKNQFKKKERIYNRANKNNETQGAESKIKYISNNLNFNFDKQEDLIESLEKTN